MISVFLGSGFSTLAGVPLASQLFDAKPEVDRITRERLVERVRERWESWRAKNARSTEEYLAYLHKGGGKAWFDAQWYVGLVIALAMGRVEVVGMQPKVTRHNLNRATGVPSHEKFWSAIFRRTQDVAVVTTNYDILPERGIRHMPRPRVPRPGFHYGWGPEPLAGGGYPSRLVGRRAKWSSQPPAAGTRPPGMLDKGRGASTRRPAPSRHTPPARQHSLNPPNPGPHPIAPPNVEPEVDGIPLTGPKISA